MVLKSVLKTTSLFLLFSFISCNNSENEKLKNELHSNEQYISEIEKNNLEIDLEVTKLNQEVEEKLELADKLRIIYEDEIKPKLFRTQEEKDYELLRINQGYENTISTVDSIKNKINELQKVQKENTVKITELQNQNDHINNKLK